MGRPRLSAELKALIGRISQENPCWGTERIRGELLKLGIVVSNRSIRRYRWRKAGPMGSQRWRTFLSNQLHGLSDLFVVHTVTFRTLYVFFFIRHERRELLHVNVTASPTAAWIWRQLLEATPWGRRPRHLIHDRDGALPVILKMLRTIWNRTWALSYTALVTGSAVSGSMCGSCAKVSPLAPANPAGGAEPA